MTPDRFRQLVDAYGGALSRWPEGERAGAVALLRDCGDLERELEHAGGLDAVLQTSVAPAPSEALRRRVLEVAPARALTRWSWVQGLGLAGACAAGLLVGVLIDPPAPQPEAAELLTLIEPYEPVEVGL